MKKICIKEFMHKLFRAKSNGETYIQWVKASYLQQNNKRNGQFVDIIHWSEFRQLVYLKLEIFPKGIHVRHQWR